MQCDSVYVSKVPFLLVQLIKTNILGGGGGGAGVWACTSIFLSLENKVTLHKVHFLTKRVGIYFISLLKHILWVQ